MNFQRQWFPPKYGEGLATEALLFESYLSNREFGKAKQQIIDFKDKMNKDYWERMKIRLENIEVINQKQKSKKELKIAFSGFWPDFNPYSNPLLLLIRASVPELKVEVTEKQNDAFIIIFSCFGDQSYIMNNNKYSSRWLYLGENVRPNYYDYDFSMSFDISDYGGKNIHLPLWLFEIDKLDPHAHSLKYLTEDHKIDYSCRKDAIAFVGNNSVPMREYLMTYLENQGFKCDRYGSQTNPIDDKIGLYNKYKLVIAMENSYHMGYVTEKLIHAHLGGAHIIYWGGVNYDSPLRANKDHIMCLSDDFDQLIPFVKKAFKNQRLYWQEKLVDNISFQAYFGKITNAIRDRLRCYL